MSAGEVVVGELAGVGGSLETVLREAVDVDEVAAALEASGVTDAVARRYGVPTVFALAEALAARFATTPSTLTPPTRPRFAGAALVRSALYLSPAALALAAGTHLDRLPRWLPAAALVLGWATMQALVYLGHVVSGRAGTVAAARFLLGGFGSVVALWSIVVAALPSTVDKGLAYPVTVAELGLYAVVAVAVVTGRARIALLWSVPGLALSIVELFGLADVPGIALLGAVALPLARVYLPAARPRAGHGPRWTPRAEDFRRAGGYAALGLGQALGFLAIATGGVGAAMPLLIGVPLTELLVARHTASATAALDTHDTPARYRRHLRRIGGTTIAALIPPLVAGVALATAGGHLPYGLDGHPDARLALLRVASGVLLAGAYAVLLLLAVLDRLGTAVTLISWPVPLAVAALAGVAPVPPPRPASLAEWGDALLPVTVGTLTVVYLVGLVAAAHAVLDPRSHR